MLNRISPCNVFPPLPGGRRSGEPTALAAGQTAAHVSVATSPTLARAAHRSRTLHRISNHNPKRQQGRVAAGVAVPRLCFGLLFLHSVAFLLASTAAADEVNFARDVLPIFEERCLFCHGEDEQESGLRLDLRANMLKGGDYGLPTIVPGKPEKSYLIEVIKHLDPDMKMPQDEEKMPAAEIEIIERWIAQGAVIPGQMEAVADEKTDHWSFQPVQRRPVPRSDYANPIDSFLAEKLKAKSLQYSEPADPRSLIRRASIVLTGIAPTPEEVAAFVAASNEDMDAAYEALIDRLLASPHFGERWAQHWLDVIRWAETNGSEANLYRKNAWIYRDYVVRAFNEDKPYDDFVREQIAGDSLGMGEATGYLVAGPHVPAATVGREPSAIRQARADRMDEIMQTVGSSVMGITIGCARCHNHKFDPISIRDYYAMTGVFQDVEFGSRFPEFSAEHPRRQRGHELRTAISQQRRKLQKTGGWEEDWGAFREYHFAPYTTKAIRIRFKSPNVGLDELEIFSTEKGNRNIAAATAGSTLSGFPEGGHQNRNPIERVTDGEFGTMAWRANFPKDSDERAWIRIDFAEPSEISRLRLSSNREYFYDTDYLDKKPYLPKYQFDLDVMDANGDWQPWTGTWAINTKLHKEHPQRKEWLKEIQQAIATLSEEGPRPSFVGRFVEPKPTFVLHRGSPESPRNAVVPGAPLELDGDLGLTEEASGSQRRAEFANWVTQPENPLTARVMVNRIWHHIFGAGIVTTTSDFGKAGAPPTHPELLDWLAAEFVEPTNRGWGFQPQAAKTQADSKTQARSDGEGSGGWKPPSRWSVKHMIRLMVMSDAFRQSSSPRETALQKDGSSALLWRYPPKRVEAEVIRDSILQASGCLDRTIGGRSYRIHNEKKTYAQWEVVDNAAPHTWRRMLYQERMRRVDDKMFTAFDFPDCGQVRAKRPVSTTPLQALNLMNSDFVMDQSRRIAERAKREAGDETRGQIVRCFELLLGRQPDEAELTACETVADNKQLHLICRALINSNEFAFVP